MLIKYETIKQEHPRLQKLYKLFNIDVVHDDLLNTNPWKIEDYVFDRMKIEYKHLAMPFISYIIWMAGFLIPYFIFEQFVGSIEIKIERKTQRIKYYTPLHITLLFKI